MSRSSPFCLKKEGIESVASHRPGKAHGMAHIPMLTLRRQAGGYAPQTPLYCSAWGKGYPQGRSWRQCKNFQHYATTQMEFLAWKVKKGKTSITIIVIPSLSWDSGLGFETAWKACGNPGWADDGDGELNEWIPFLHPKRRRPGRNCRLSIVSVAKCNLEGSWWSLLVWQTCANMMCPKVLQSWVDASRCGKLWFSMSVESWYFCGSVKDLY